MRTLQYFARFYAWYLYRTNHHARVIAPFEAIKKQFGLTRKAMRLGKNIEHFKAAAVAVDNKGMDPILRYCAIGRQLGYGMYLSLDAITFVSSQVSHAEILSNLSHMAPETDSWSLSQLDSAGIRPFASVKRLQQEAYRAWFIGLACNTMAGLYTLWQLRRREQSIDKKDGESMVESKKIVR